MTTAAQTLTDHLTDRLADRLTDHPRPSPVARLLRRAGHGLLRAADAWQGWRARRAAARRGRLDAMLDEELSAALLRDIGAPPWLEQAAAGRRAADAMRLDALRAQGGRLHG